MLIDLCESAVSIVDAATNGVLTTVPLPADTCVQDVAVHPAGSFVYVTNLSGNTVFVLDTVTNAVVAAVSVGDHPYGVAVHPAGTFVYVANEVGNTVSVLDTALNGVVSTVPVGLDPEAVAVQPAGTFVYVTNHGGDTVSVLDTVTSAVVATIPVGSGPAGLAVHPAGTFVYVANNGRLGHMDRTVSVIAAASSTVVATISVGRSPHDVAMHPTGAFVYVTTDGDHAISVLDTGTNAVVATVPVGNLLTGFGQFVGPDTPGVSLTLNQRAFHTESSTFNCFSGSSRVRPSFASVTAQSEATLTVAPDGSVTTRSADGAPAGPGVGRGEQLDSVTRATNSATAVAFIESF